MATRVDLTGLDNLHLNLVMLRQPNFAPLMQQWENVIREDNRRGVLAGLDKSGIPLTPVTYRPRSVSIKSVRFGRKNPTGREYLAMSGPPLAPRGPNSRVITNLVTSNGRNGGIWFAEGAWHNVKSRSGVPFLMAHFTGAATGRNHAVILPVRDLRGVRPQGIDEARKLLKDFVLRIING